MPNDKEEKRDDDEGDAETVAPIKLGEGEGFGFSCDCGNFNCRRWYDYCDKCGEHEGFSVVGECNGCGEYSHTHDES